MLRYNGKNNKDILLTFKYCEEKNENHSKKGNKLETSAKLLRLIPIFFSFYFENYSEMIRNECKYAQLLTNDSMRIHFYLLFFVIPTRNDKSHLHR